MLCLRGSSILILWLRGSRTLSYGNTRTLSHWESHTLIHRDTRTLILRRRNNHIIARARHLAVIGKGHLAIRLTLHRLHLRQLDAAHLHALVLLVGELLQRGLADLDLRHKGKAADGGQQKIEPGQVDGKGQLRRSRSRRGRTARWLATTRRCWRPWRDPTRDAASGGARGSGRRRT